MVPQIAIAVAVLLLIAGGRHRDFGGGCGAIVGCLCSVPLLGCHGAGCRAARGSIAGCHC